MPRGLPPLFIDGQPAKRCPKCKRELLQTEFYRRGGKRKDLYSRCKECVNQENRDRHNFVYKVDPATKERARQRGRKWHLENAERASNSRKANHRRQRLICIQHYGGACQCCGERRVEFLALDHVNGGGHKHRKECGGKMCRWLIKHGFPDEPKLRILCHNCNMARAFYGYCPHQREESEVS